MFGRLLLKLYLRKLFPSRKNTLHRHYKYRTVTWSEQETRCALIVCCHVIIIIIIIIIIYRN